MGGPFHVRMIARRRSGVIAQGAHGLDETDTNLVLPPLLSSRMDALETSDG
jgi:hypothetical protein